MPNVPERVPLPVLTAEDHRLQLLHNRVKNALEALPGYFRSETRIDGIQTGDLFSLNSVLGGTIEREVVITLNRLRDVWDPDDHWGEYHFIRRTQAFPDVRLMARINGIEKNILGIELKGWYLLAKEKEPSFRYEVNENACTPYDLLVVIPWHLKNVLSGIPVVRSPFIEQAVYASHMRTYYWKARPQKVSQPPDYFEITSPPGATPYPAKIDAISDKAVRDNGKNFGRIARTGIMSDFIEQTLLEPILGIEPKYWIDFFSVFRDATDRETVETNLAKLYQSAGRSNPDERAERILDLLRDLSAQIDL
jgi:hypothetical protein